MGKTQCVTDKTLSSQSLKSRTTRRTCPVSARQHVAAQLDVTDPWPLLLTEAPEAVVDPMFTHVLPLVNVPVGSREADQVEQEAQAHQGKGDLDGQRQLGHGGGA